MADIVIDGGTAYSSYDASTDGGTAATTGVTSLSPYQLSYNGLVFGAGCDVQLVSVTGLREAPATRGGDLAKPRRHGSFAGLTLFGERIVTMTLGVSVTVAGFESVVSGMAAAFANISDPDSLLPLQFNLSPAWASARQVVGRVTKAGYPVDVDYGHSYLKAIPVEITCPDPLIYDTATQNSSAALPSPTAGLAFPAGFPLAFGASAGGSMQVVNNGNETLYPAFLFTGPVTWPTVTFGAATLGFQVTLGAGDTLLVDCSAGTAVLNGAASRAGTIITGSTYFGIPPGGGTVGFSSVDAVQVTGTVTCTGLPVAAWGWC